MYSIDGKRQDSKEMLCIQILDQQIDQANLISGKLRNNAFSDSTHKTKVV